MAYKTFILGEEDGNPGVDFTDGQRDQHPVTALLLRYQGDIVDLTRSLNIFCCHVSLLCKGHSFLGMHRRKGLSDMEYLYKENIAVTTSDFTRPAL